MRVNASHRRSGLSPGRALVRAILKHVGNPRISVRLWNGEEFQLTDERPVACMEIRRPSAALRLALSPSVGFGECYSQGLIEVHGDLLAFVNEITRATTRHTAHRYYAPRIGSMLRALNVNSMGRSRHNVHHHYDIGNDFYRLWLDPDMVYTCAYYRTADATLSEAQVAKLDHVCRKLRLRPGQKVIEAGCGWGALALHMARHYGVDVTAYNTSREQVVFARERAAALSLEDRVTFIEDDYRNIEGRCDAFVSVGMLEHVGLARYRALGRIIRRCLKPHGLGLVHSIGRSHSQPMDPWIVKHIFPGGYVPSLSEMMAIFEPNRFSVADVENLRLHYARTCKDWLRNFDAVADQVADSYDEQFVRMWRLYLAGSSAGFESGSLQLYQVLFAPPENNDVPLTRQYQYSEVAPAS